MELSNNILPLGSVVYLKNSKDKVMVICRGAIYGNEDNEEYFDYLGCVYPNGLDKDRTIFFNEDSIEEILFEGYKDESEKRLSNLYVKWRSETTVKKGVSK